MTSCPVTPSSATAATSRFDWGSTMLKLLSPLLATTSSPGADAALATRTPALNKTAAATSSRKTGHAREENLAIVISAEHLPAIKVTQTAARSKGGSAGRPADLL